MRTSATRTLHFLFSPRLPSCSAWMKSSRCMHRTTAHQQTLIWSKEYHQERDVLFPKHRQLALQQLRGLRLSEDQELRPSSVTAPYSNRGCCCSIESWMPLLSALPGRLLQSVGLTVPCSPPHALPKYYSWIWAHKT